MMSNIRVNLILTLSFEFLCSLMSQWNLLQCNIFFHVSSVKATYKNFSLFYFMEHSCML